MKNNTESMNPDDETVRRTSIKLSVELIEALKLEAERNGAQNLDEFIRFILAVYKDRAGSPYLIENAYVVLTLQSLTRRTEQLVLSNYSVAESIASFHSEVAGRGLDLCDLTLELLQEMKSGKSNMEGGNAK